MTTETYTGTMIQELIVTTEWSLDEWRGQLCNAKQIAHEIELEAIQEGRRCD